MVARTSASGRNGITRNHSVTRNSTAAGQPSRKPEASPTVVPITIEMSVASSPTNSETRAPQISWVRIDRPLSSVPSQYSLDGGSSTAPVALVMSSPSGSASTGAKTATPMKNSSSPSPNMPDRWLRKSRQLRLNASARRRRARARARDLGGGVGAGHVRTRGSRRP